MTLIFGLTACGGSDDASEAPLPASIERAINSTNFTRVAGEVLHGIELPMSGFNSLIEETFILTEVAPSVAVRTKRLRGASTGGKFQAQAAFSLSTDCATTGRLKRTVSQAVQGQLTVGDFAVRQFDACVEGEFEFFGKGHEVVTAVDASQSLFTTQAELTGFGATNFGTTLLVSGSYDLTMDYTVAQRTKSTLSADKAINFERRIGQQTVAAYSIKDMKRSLEIVGESALYDVSYTATGRFPQLGSTQFQVSTQGILEFKLVEGTYHGAIKVVGIDGSSVRLTYLGDTNLTLRLDLDANGDGSTDQSQSLTLDELLLPILVAQ